jgi:hypothetical protein
MRTWDFHNTTQVCIHWTATHRAVGGQMTHQLLRWSMKTNFFLCAVQTDETSGQTEKVCLLGKHTDCTDKAYYPTA